jgi:hypothetical protein
MLTSKRAQALTIIDLSLRFALFGIGCAMRVEFSAKEIERVFQDFADDQVSAKQYVFFDDGKTRVDGNVHEYEPGTIKLNLRNTSVTQCALDNIIERARYQSLRIETHV